MPSAFYVKIINIIKHTVFKVIFYGNKKPL